MNKISRVIGRGKIVNVREMVGVFNSLPDL